MSQWVAERLAEWFDAEAIAETLVAETAPEMITEPSRWVADAYERDRGTSWRAAVSGSVQAGLAGIDEPLRSRLRELLGGDEQMCTRHAWENLDVTEAEAIRMGSVVRTDSAGGRP